MNGVIELIRGDITKLNVDAIVNAANSSLRGGGGVDGAIHKAAGASLHEECMEIVKRQNGCPTGQAVITGGGNLPSKYVIHAVGPVWNGGSSNENALLASAYGNCLRIALENGVKSIAFPNISTGTYGFPKDLAAETAISVVRDFLESEKGIEKVVFVCFDEENYSIYKTKLHSKNLISRKFISGIQAPLVDVSILYI